MSKSGLAFRFWMAAFGVFLCCGAVSGAPIVQDDAVKAVRGWLKQGATRLRDSLGNTPTGVTAYRNAAGSVVYYVVDLAPSGFIIVSADDEVEPVIAFAAEGVYEPSDANPLGALVGRDLPGRLAVVRQAPQREAALSAAGPAAAQGKWRTLLDRADVAAVENGLGTVADARVYPLVASNWSQTTVSGNACYNYYTPPNAEGTAANYPSGCVATACAQLMRFWQHPTAGVGTASFNISVSGAATTRSLRGGNGAGGPYAWANMVLTPSAGTTLAQCQAIGALCHDAGVAVNMNYAAGASGTDTMKAADSLKDTFGYSNAVKGYNSANNIGPGLNAMVNPNLDAGYPVLLGISGPPGGHAIVCDGYGYDTGTLYHHCNMGWAGSQNAWYNLPTIDAGSMTFTSTYKCVYNVYVTGTGEIISGRVTDAGGAPIAGATVLALRTGGGSFSATSNARGVYALPKVPASSTYTVSCTASGYTFSNCGVNTGVSTDYDPVSGNVWGVNFTGTPASPTTTASTTTTTGTGATTTTTTGTGTTSTTTTTKTSTTTTASTTSTTSTTTTTTLPNRFYVNDGAFNEPGSVCSAPGDDMNDGWTTASPMRTVQALLNKYPTIGTGRTVWIDPGTHAGPVSVAASHAGLKLQGAGADKCVLDAGQANTALILTSIGAGEVSGLTLRNGKAQGATTAERCGGGIRVYGASTPVISNCIITVCSAASGYGGGAIYAHSASPTFVNCLLYRNTSSGGALRTYNGAVSVVNCTIADNVGGGIWRTGTGTLNVTNAIVWGNGDDLNGCAATYSCIEDGDAGAGNIKADPSFIDPAAGNYRLSGGSPCIDAANAAAALATDILGHPRRDDPGTPPDGVPYPDMGAYEFQETTPPAVLYVNDGVVAGDLFCTAPGDDNNDGWTPATPMRSIQALLNKYPKLTARTLKVDAGVYSENITLTAVRSGWRFLGAGADKVVIDGNGMGPVFSALGYAEGEISGFTIQNGSSAGSYPYQNGGGIQLLAKSSPLVANNIIRWNTASVGGCGGGLFAYSNSEPVVVNCLVYGNTRGGISFFNAGGSVVNCTVTANSVLGVGKGGTGDLFVGNCILWANGKDLNGCAAVYSCIEDGNAGTGNISASPRFVNAAAGNFALSAGSPCIDAASPDYAPPTDILGNARLDDAGVAPNGQDWPDMGAYEFQGDSAGAVVYVNDAAIAQAGSLCTAAGNDANDGLSPAAPMRTVQAALDKYPALGAGKTLWIDPGTYVGNVVVGPGHAGLKIQGAGASRTILDGAKKNTVLVLNGFGSGVVAGLTLRNGLAHGMTLLECSGGGIRLTGASTPVISACIVKSCASSASATGFGGGAIYSADASVTITDCLLYGNTGANGTILAANGVVSVRNCTVADNATGGGIWRVGSGALTVRNSIVWEAAGDDLNNCMASYSCIQDGDSGTRNISADPLFANPSAGNYTLAAGSPCIDTAYPVGVSLLDLAGNPRRDDAGMPPNGAAMPDMGAFEFTGDTQNSIVYVNDSSTGEPGSLCLAPGNDLNHGFSPRLPMRTIQGALNKYPTFGVGKTVSVDPGVYSENVAIASTHAGLKIRGAGASRSVVDGRQTNPVISAVGFGAGQITGFTLRNGKAQGTTTADKCGGGARFSGASTPLLADCIIKGCSATTGYGGGAVFVNGASATLRNCLIYGNSSSGGAVRSADADVAVLNCTIANNTGGGIWQTGTSGAVTVTNCIVWGNGDDLNGCAATCSCIEDGDAGTGNLAANPSFVDAAAGDYHLNSGSPCIDKGTATGAPATDLDGDARDATPDMGAYEYPS